MRGHVEGIANVHYQDEPTVGLASAKECRTMNTVYPRRVTLRNLKSITRNITIYVRDESQ